MRVHSIAASVLLAVQPALSYNELTDTTIATYPAAIEDDFNIYNQNGLLAPILIPRVPDTEGSVKVRQHFADFFRDQLPAWTVTYQKSSSQTPISNGNNVSFVNMIITRDPPWADPDHSSRLVLVAHYDSLWQPEGFLGAIDSAAPCAMLMHAAKSIDDALTNKWTAMKADGAHMSELDEHKGIQILLLDGEEAFMTWSETDSVYGARSLAEEWENTVHSAMSPYRNPLQSIELFVLLDLLGSAGPRVPSYYKTTHWAYQKMATLEKRLRSAGRMKTGTKEAWLYDAVKDDKSRWLGGVIGDDHVPFMARGVECLHVIPYNGRFPEVWHTVADDGEHLDMPTVLDWATLTSAFAAEWLELDDYISNNQQRSESGSRWSEKSEL